MESFFLTITTAVSPSNEFLKQKFDIEEEILTYFNCALVQNITIQGAVYLTNTSLCFHSIFNSQTFLGGETTLMLDYTKITLL
jgi:hypothetical protein